MLGQNSITPQILSELLNILLSHPAEIGFSETIVPRTLDCYPVPVLDDGFSCLLQFSFILLTNCLILFFSSSPMESAMSELGKFHG